MVFLHIYVAKWGFKKINWEIEKEIIIRFNMKKLVFEIIF